MDTSNIYNDPIIGMKRKGTSDDPYKTYNEPQTIINGRAQLTEIPNRFSKVIVTGDNKTWFEVEDGELLNNYFKVDYVNGIVYFDTSNNNKTLLFSYLGEGVLFNPASRIWTQQYAGSVTETLEDIIEIGRNIYKSPVSSFENISVTYPTPEHGWTVQTTNDGRFYRWDSTASEWIYAQILNPTQVTQLSSELGIIGNLTTSSKSNLVNAVNEHDAEIGNINVLTTTNKSNLVNAINENVSNWNKNLTMIKEISINVKNYGATGDGVTDDTTAIQNAINIVIDNGGGTVYFPKGKYKITSVEIINAKNVSLLGDSGSIIYEGSIIIGENTLNPTMGTEFIHVEGLEFLFENYPDSNPYYGNQKGIILANSAFVTITRNYFQSCSEAIYVMPLWLTQHVKRVRIQENIFKEVNYAFYVDNPSAINGSTPKQKSIGGDLNPIGGTGLFFLGDSHFINNQVTHLYDGIHGSGFDGFIVQGNTFFTSGAGSTTRRHNINIDYANYLVISDNNLFESGENGVHLNRFKHTQVSHNNIALNVNNGIWMGGGDYDTNPQNYAVVDGNTIELAGNIGIEIVGNCGVINVTNNIINKTGSLVGVRANDTTSNIYVSGNQIPENSYDILNSSGNKGDNILDSTIVEGTETSLTFTPSYNDVRNILFPRPFKSGTSPKISLQIVGMTNKTPVTTIVQYANNTGFWISGLSGVNTSVDIEWSARGQR